MARGVDGRKTFIDDSDRRDFLRVALLIRNEIPFSILAYCLMNNHFHFAIKVKQTPLSRIMHRLLTTYVLRFNARHNRQGHLFQARYKAVQCTDDAYLISLVRYIHMNPVRAGLVASPADWPWSSYPQYAEPSNCGIAETEIFCDAAGSEATADYERWTTQLDTFAPWPKAEVHPALMREEPSEGRSLDSLAQAMFPGQISALRAGCRRRDIVKLKALFADRAAREGHQLTLIAAWMRCTPQNVHRLLQLNK